MSIRFTGLNTDHYITLIATPYHVLSLCIANFIRTCLKQALNVMKKSSPKKCVNCSQLKMILSCRLLGHLFDDLFMIVVVGKHIEHTAACAPFIMLIDQD